MAAENLHDAARPRLLVVGCGGIGGTIAAALVQVGEDVTALTTNELIADAVNAHGFRTRGEQSLGVVRGRAVTKLREQDGRFDYVLLCTQPPQVEEAARSVLDRLSDRGVMVVFQNGLCEPRIAAIAGAGKVIGGIITWGASMVEPGVYDRTSSGGFTLGRIEGSPDERVHELARLLEAVGPVATTANLMGARWSKLAINCAISSLGTVGGDRLGVLMRKRHVRRLALELMSETVEVARAEGHRLEKVSGTIDLEWIALTEAEQAASVGSAGLLAKHALLLAVGTRYRRLRSSMLNAIERGRPVAVDFLNGEVVAHARRHGIATPINAAIAEEVKRIAAGKQTPSHETLLRFFERTRELLAGGATSEVPLPEPPVAEPPAPEPPAPEPPAPEPPAPEPPPVPEPPVQGPPLAEPPVPEPPVAEPPQHATAQPLEPAAAEVVSAAVEPPLIEPLGSEPAAVEPAPPAAPAEPPAEPPTAEPPAEPAEGEPEAPAEGPPEKPKVQESPREPGRPYFPEPDDASG